MINICEGCSQVKHKTFTSILSSVLKLSSVCRILKLLWSLLESVSTIRCPISIFDLLFVCLMAFKLCYFHIQWQHIHFLYSTYVIVAALWCLNNAVISWRIDEITHPDHNSFLKCYEFVLWLISAQYIATCLPVYKL